MDRNQLNSLFKDLEIARNQILREEAEMTLLNELAKDKLGSKIVFYGGTALRLAYNSPRFSEDIDLLRIKPISFSEFKNFLLAVAKKQNWIIKDTKDKRQTMFTLILIKNTNLKHGFSIKIEIHKPTKKINLDSKLMILKSPTSILEPMLLAPSLLNIKQMKINALAGRQKARDIFDLWYIAQSLRENFVPPEKLPDYSERDFKNELQVFLPKKYYPVIAQLYGEINKTNKKHS